MNMNEKMTVWKSTIADTTATTADKITARANLAMRDDNGELFANCADRLEKVNADLKRSACSVAVAVDGAIQWGKLVDGVVYFRFTVDDDGTAKPHKVELKVSDVLCKKETANSTKTAIPSDLFKLFAVFGGNLSDHHTAEIAEYVDTLKRYNKYLLDDKLSYFYKAEPTKEGERTADPTSKKSLERQLQYISDTILGENFVKIRTADIAHLSAEFNKVTKKGWKNGNEIALIQLIVEHIRNARNDIKYTKKSALDIHKAVKNAVPVDKKPTDSKPNTDPEKPTAPDSNPEKTPEKPTTAPEQPDKIMPDSPADEWCNDKMKETGCSREDAEKLFWAMLKAMD